MCEPTQRPQISQIQFSNQTEVTEPTRKEPKSLDSQFLIVNECARWGQLPNVPTDFKNVGGSCSAPTKGLTYTHPAPFLYNPPLASSPQIVIQRNYFLQRSPSRATSTISGTQALPAMSFGDDVRACEPLDPGRCPSCLPMAAVGSCTPILAS